MTDNELLEKAAMICVTEHAGQTDKAGQAYFQHPMRVALRCKTNEQKIVALLHDILEDTAITSQELLRQGFPQVIVDAVGSVTKREGESYEDFIIRASFNPIGRFVKLHDLEDNLNICRVGYIDEAMAQRLNKYLNARAFLEALGNDITSTRILYIDSNNQICSKKDAKFLVTYALHTDGSVSKSRSEINDNSNR